MLSYLLRFWPILLPIIIYLVWLFIARNKAKKAGEEVLPGLTDGPWVWAVAATFVLAAGFFIFMGLSSTPTDSSYSPARMENGKLVPGKIGN